MKTLTFSSLTLVVASISASCSPVTITGEGASSGWRPGTHYFATGEPQSGIQMAFSLKINESGKVESCQGVMDGKEASCWEEWDEEVAHNFPSVIFSPDGDLRAEIRPLSEGEVELVMWSEEGNDKIPSARWFFDQPLITKPDNALANNEDDGGDSIDWYDPDQGQTPAEYCRCEINKVKYTCKPKRCRVPSSCFVGSREQCAYGTAF